MPFLTWLRALFSGPAHAARPPTAPPPTAHDLPNSLQPDNGVRMHIAAHDPEFPTKRDRAFETISAAIDAVALAHDFTKKPMSWAKTGDLGTVSIHLQRSRYGFDCHINLGFQPLDESADGPWAQDDFVPLGRFYPPNPASVDEPGTIAYLDVHTDAGSLDQPMTILNAQALPWLVAHLTNPAAAKMPFLPGPVSLP